MQYNIFSNIPNILKLYKIYNIETLNKQNMRQVHNLFKLGSLNFRARKQLSFRLRGLTNLISP